MQGACCVQHSGPYRPTTKTDCRPRRRTRTPSPEDAFARAPSLPLESIPTTLRIAPCAKDGWDPKSVVRSQPPAASRLRSAGLTQDFLPSPFKRAPPCLISSHLRTISKVSGHPCLSTQTSLLLFSLKTASQVCAFHGNASSADQIQQSVFDLLDAVSKDPVPVPGPAGNGRSVDFDNLKTAILNALYHPYSVYPYVARGLADLKNGNGTIISYLGGISKGSIEVSNLAPDFVYDTGMQTEGLVAVACSDAGSAVASVDEMKTRYEEAEKFSSFSDLFITTESACGGWKVRPETTFRGPIAADNTSFPILLIGNTFDPVTPLSAANLVSANFPGSVVLAQNSGGHSSLSAPSNCSRKYFLDYFLKGSLPEPGTTCEVDFEVFTHPGNGAAGLYL